MENWSKDGAVITPVYCPSCEQCPGIAHCNTALNCHSFMSKMSSFDCSLWLRFAHVQCHVLTVLTQSSAFSFFLFFVFVLLLGVDFVE